MDETLDQLEQQANILKQHNGILTRITQLASDIEKGTNEFAIGNKNFGELKKEIQTSLTDFKKEVVNLEKANERLTEQLISANKNLHKELEQTVSSKMERFSSDIQVVIRQERTQLQEALQVTLDKQYNDFQGKLIEQNKKISLLKILMIISIVISVLLGVVILIK